MMGACCPQFVHRAGRAEVRAMRQMIQSKTSGDGVPNRHANSKFKPVVTIIDLGSVYKELDHVPRKDP